MPSKSRRSSRRSGGGYQTSQQFFNPAVLPPAVSGFTSVVSTAPTEYAVRPVLNSTFQAGAGRTRRSNRKGGFSPSVMGSFVANAQAAIVPLALYAVYHTFVPKKNSAVGGRKSRRNTRK
jgi:hypothetical protein